MKHIPKSLLAIFSCLIVFNAASAKEKEIENKQQPKINYFLIDKSVNEILNKNVDSFIYNAVWDYNDYIGKNCLALDKMIENIYQSTKIETKMCIFQNNIAVLINIKKSCDDIDENNIVKSIDMKTKSM